MPTHQLIRPAGQSVEFGRRPVDLVLSPDGRSLYVKDSHGFVVIDTATWKIRQELAFNGGGGSVHGLVVTRDGSRLYATTAHDILWEAKVLPDGNLELGRKLTFPVAGGGKAISSDSRARKMLNNLSCKILHCLTRVRRDCPCTANRIILLTSTR